jgi:hypothetical protein
LLEHSLCATYINLGIPQLIKLLEDGIDMQENKGNECCENSMLRCFRSKVEVNLSFLPSEVTKDPWSVNQGQETTGHLGNDKENGWFEGRVEVC